MLGGALGLGVHANVREGGKVAANVLLDLARERVSLGERVLGMLARAPAAREEGLERLRGELDDAVAVDSARPTAAQALALGAEHAEFQCPSQ